jgi:hypothetical protein
MDKVAPTATTVWLSEATGRCARSPPARAAGRSRWRGSVPGCVRAVGDRDLREQRLERGGRFRLLAHSRSSLAEPSDTGNGRDIQRAVLPARRYRGKDVPDPARRPGSASTTIVVFTADNGAKHRLSERWRHAVQGPEGRGVGRRLPWPDGVPLAGRHQAQSGDQPAREASAMWCASPPGVPAIVLV